MSYGTLLVGGAVLLTVACLFATFMSGSLLFFLPIMFAGIGTYTALRFCEDAMERTPFNTWAEWRYDADLEGEVNDLVWRDLDAERHTREIIPTGGATPDFMLDEALLMGDEVSMGAELDGEA
jgi:hypothetical protein